MKKLNNKGFGITVVLIIVVIVGLIGVAGWLVYDRQKDNTENSQTAQQEPEKEIATKEEKRVTLLSKEDVNVTYVSLPEGWKLSEDCQDDENYPTEILLPPGKEKLRCRSEDWGFAAFSIAPTADGVEKDCSGEEDKIKEDQQNDYFVSYSCDEIVVSGNKGIKETHVSNEKAAFTEGDTFTEYSFVLENGKVFRVSYTNPTSLQKPEYTEQLESFVESLEF
jgi:hypothetical protein